MTTTVAMLWRGDPATAPARHPRLEPISDALAARGIAVVEVPWSEEAVEQTRARLLRCDGVLVWMDPLTNGQDRVLLDSVLREVSEQGVWVSAHPDVILKMGVKEVLVRTRSLGWGTDTQCYETAEAFRSLFPARLAGDGVRVLKQNRGNGSQGVWKVALSDPRAAIGPRALVTVLEARSDTPETALRLGDFMGRCEAYLDGAGRIIDQAFQPRVGEGLVRCYMCRDRVVGFSEQFPRSRSVEPAMAPTFGMAREKTMHRETAPQFRALRRRMEEDWTPGLQGLLGIVTEDLPVLWDADFLYGPKTPDGEDSYVLCEINVSCVVPFPLTAVPVIAKVVDESIALFRTQRRVQRV
ncbi:Cj0069 family protein [Azospirillum sp. Marseille-Q6669]